MEKFDNILDSGDSTAYQFRASIQFKDGKYVSISCAGMCVLSGDYGFCVPGIDEYRGISKQLISKNISFFENIEHIFIPSEIIQFMAIIIEKT